MPDMTPVGNTIIPPNPQAGLNTMSSLLGVRQQQQNLQTGQYTQQSAQANAQQDQQKNAQLTAAQSLAINGAKSGKYTNPDGTFNRQKMADDMSMIGPYTQQAAGQLLSQANEVVANSQAHQNLTMDRKKEISNTFASLAADPQVDNSKVIDAVERLRQAHPNEPEFSRLLTSMTAHMPNTAGAPQLQQLLGQWASAGTGEGQLEGGTNAAGQNQVVNKFTQARGMPQLQGEATNPTSSKVAAQTATGLIPPTNMAGQSGNDVTRYSQIGQEGTNAQTGVQLANQVAKLADQVRTGQLSKEWADRLTLLKQQDPTITDRQMLSKYAAQLKTMATQGATTDASRSQIDEGMPSPETMNPDAVKQAAQYVGGIFSMRGARQKVADQYVKNNGNSIGLQGVDNEFMRAADPTIFAYKQLPAGPERQAYLKAHGLTTPEAQAAFKARMNQVNHYSGGQ